MSMVGEDKYIDYINKNVKAGRSYNKCFCELILKKQA